MCLRPDPGAPDEDWSIGNAEACDAGVVASLPDALVALAAMPDCSDGSGRPPGLVFGTRYAETRAETLPAGFTIDNSANQVGNGLEFALNGLAFCAPEDAPAGAAIIAAESDSPLYFNEVVLDQRAGGPCQHAASTGLRVDEAPGGLLVLDSLFAGFEGPALHAAWTSGSGELSVGYSSFLGGSGQAVRSDFAQVSVVDSRIAGFRFDPGDDRGLIDAAGFNVRVGRSLLDGNHIGSGSLVRGGFVRVQESTLHRNVVGGTGRLLHLPYVDPPLVGNLDDRLDWTPGVTHSLISENRRVGMLPGSPPAAPDGTVTGTADSCSAATRQTLVEEAPLEPRSPEYDLLPLIHIDPALTANAQAMVVFAGNWFVSNDSGESALVSADTIGAELTVEFMHNTFADMGDGPALEVDPLVGGSASVVLVGNLWRGPLPSGDRPAAVLPGSVQRRTITMNAGPADLRWSDSISVETAIEGPNPDHDLSASAAGALTALDTCAQQEHRCPERTAMACDADRTRGDGPPMSCVPTVLAAWEPDAAGSAEVLRPWPWETTFFGDADALRAGASGLDCDRAYFSYDQLYAGPGDGDGFADVVDCDNEDAAARPRLPALDGWATPECDSPDDDCYVCPSAGDDDDSASGGDDDDAGDDDRAEGPSAGPPPPDANADARQVDPGCVNACGYSWTPRFTLLLFILPFAARRPYSPRSHHSVSSTRPGR